MIVHRTPGRRRLRFRHCDDIVADIEALTAGHRTLGNWSLAQVCWHLAGTQEFSVAPTVPDIHTSRLFQVTLGRVALGVLLWFRYIPEQQGGLSPLPPVDFNEAWARLRAATLRISTEPMVARHPIFGRMTHRQWRLFHLHHAAHHLSFVIPTGMEAGHEARS